jgi:hypothetical protein
VNVEHPDKRFLRTHFGHDDGWLFKKSGGDDDGYKTNETMANPYEERMCFWDANPCATPSSAELETLLPTILDVEQMLRFGAGNALIANADGPLGKDNNFYFYDWPGPRIYFAWDLDTTQRETPAIFGAPGEEKFTSVLFTHWEDDYDQLLTGLLAGELALAQIESELDRALAVGGAALDADPFAIGDPAADAIDSMRGWWSARHAQVSSELASH